MIIKQQIFNYHITTFVVQGNSKSAKIPMMRNLFLLDNKIYSNDGICKDTNKIFLQRFVLIHKGKIVNIPLLGLIKYVNEHYDDDYMYFDFFGKCKKIPTYSSNYILGSNTMYNLIEHLQSKNKSDKFVKLLMK